MHPTPSVLSAWPSHFILSGVISPLFSSSILDTSWPGGLSFSVIYFCLFILFMVFPRQECWSGLSFPSQVNHILSEVSNHDLSKLGGPTWHSFQFHWVTQSYDQCNHFIYFSVIVVSILFNFWWIKIRGLCQLPYGRDWLWGKLGSCSGGQSHAQQIFNKIFCSWVRLAPSL